MAMEQEIRENAGNEMQDNIENVEGTKKWGNLETNATGSSGTDAEADQPEFPRASEEEVSEAAERAKAKFGGTYDGGGGVESEADESIARGEDASAESSGSTGGGETPSAQNAETQNAEDGGEAPSAQDVEDQAEAGDELTTGQKFAGILASDSNMKWESKIAEKLSGGDDENTSGA